MNIHIRILSHHNYQCVMVEIDPDSHSAFRSKSPSSNKPKLAQNNDCEVSHRFANLLHVVQDSGSFSKSGSPPGSW